MVALYDLKQVFEFAALPGLFKCGIAKAGGSQYSVFVRLFEFGNGTTQNNNAIKMCPNCDIPLKRDKKCLKCERCGFSTCEL